MHLPPRQYAAFAFVAAAGLYLAFRTQPANPPDDPPDADPMEQLPEVVHLRTQAKARIVGEVIDGRRSLLDAASVLVIPIPDGLSIPTRTEDERYCWSVALWVRSQFANMQSPGVGSADERAAAAVARLVAEYEAELTRRGTIRLPDPSALESAEVLIERARAESAKSLRQRP